ncbi:MAG: type II/IV secretion system protein, partial [Gammaproteobacteria bacterium]
IYETLIIDSALRKLINTNAELDSIQSVALKQNMHTLRISGAHKIAEGLTTLEEIYSVIPPGEDEV